MQGKNLNLHTPLFSWVMLKGQILKLCRFKYIFTLSTKTYFAAVCYDLNDTVDELQVKINGMYVL